MRLTGVNTLTLLDEIAFSSHCKWQTRDEYIAKQGGKVPDLVSEWKAKLGK